MKNKIINRIIYIGLLVILPIILIGEILFINYKMDNDSKFRTNFNLMFGYRAWGRDYAQVIIEEKYKGEEISYSYELAHINSEFDDDVIKPYFVTLYFLTDEKSITYIAWTDGCTYTIEWEELKEYEN